MPYNERYATGSKKQKSNKKGKTPERPDVPAKPMRHYSAIPNSTIQNLIGAERWEALLDYIESKHGTRKIILGYHQQGCGGHVYLTNPNGKCLGPLSELEHKAQRKVKRREK